MFIPRGNDIESCPSGHVSCTPANIAISGTDPSTNSDPAGSPSYVSKPGMHRYIGVIMVVAIVLIGVVLWAYLAKYPRRKLNELSQRCGCCSARRSKSLSEKSNPGDISSTTSTSSSNTSRGEFKEGDKEGGEAAAGDEAGAKSDRRRAEKAKLREKERNRMLQAEPRGVIKEVSGGVVMYTEVPRPALLPRSDRYPRTEWEFQHVHGVRFEVSIVSSFTFISLPLPLRILPLLSCASTSGWKPWARWTDGEPEPLAVCSAQLLGAVLSRVAGHANIDIRIIASADRLLTPRFHHPTGSVATPPFQEQALEPAQLVGIISAKAKTMTAPAPA